MTLLRLGLPAAIGLVLLASWWLACAEKLFPAGTVPHPADVLRAFVEQARTGRLLEDVITRFISQRFSDFPTVVESLKTRKVDATFLLAPLAMVLREQGVPIHIVYLGHRDGSTVIVSKQSTARTLRDLKGKTFARPSKFSNQYLVIAKLMEDEGMQPGDIRFVDMAPPDMPSALSAGAGSFRSIPDGITTL